MTREFVYMISVTSPLGTFCGMLRPMMLRFDCEEYAQVVCDRYNADDKRGYTYRVVKNDSYHWLHTAPELIIAKTSK